MKEPYPYNPLTSEIIHILVCKFPPFATTKHQIGPWNSPWNTKPRLGRSTSAIQRTNKWIISASPEAATKTKAVSPSCSLGLKNNRVVAHPTSVSECQCHIFGGFVGEPGTTLKKKKTRPILSIESWLLNRDPYNGLLQSLDNWVVHTLNNKGLFHCSVALLLRKGWFTKSLGSKLSIKTNIYKSPRPYCIHKYSPEN